mmetsp:Transcript_43204/g.85186  ORF Transcript_43204/g.85186 Transcript_43204/m.85186 type:complete len:114 (+) Transcript_43204:321-662(+)
MSKSDFFKTPIPIKAKSSARARPDAETAAGSSARPFFSSVDGEEEAGDENEEWRDGDRNGDLQGDLHCLLLRDLAVEGEDTKKPVTDLPAQDSRRQTRLTRAFDLNISPTAAW